MLYPYLCIHSFLKSLKHVPIYIVTTVMQEKLTKHYYIMTSKFCTEIAGADVHTGFVKLMV